MKPNTVVITLGRLRELEKYEEAIKEKLSIEVFKEEQYLGRDVTINKCVTFISDNEALKKIKEKGLSIFSDSELQKEVLDRLKNFTYRSNFHKLREYFRDGFVDKHMITTLSAWQFLRWKKRND